MVSPLDHKLLRDLWRVKGQAVAIGTVIAVGVMMLVMMTGLVSSLNETRAAYYERYRLADVFAPINRAPERLLPRLAAIDGVGAVEGRVTGNALIDVANSNLPVQAQVVSLPEFREPRLNAVYLTDGRMIYGGDADEVLLLQSFAKAHGLEPGNQLSATMNGVRRTFRIAGLAQSPEFLYTTAPGELVPDDARFGVLWINSRSLAATYDMQGAFNEALISLSRNANELAVLAAVDRFLGPYGGTGAYLLADQTSNRLGALLGYYLSFGIASGFSTDLYQIPAVFDPGSYGFAALVVIGAAVASGALVKRDLDNTELVSALKTRE